MYKQISDIPYPLSVAVSLLHYCFWSNKKTEHMTPSEMKEAMKVFFTDEQIAEAIEILTEGNKNITCPSNQGE